MVESFWLSWVKLKKCHSWKHLFHIGTSASVTYQITWPVPWPVKRARYEWMEEDLEKCHQREKRSSVPPSSSWWHLIRRDFSFCTFFPMETLQHSNVVPVFFMYSCLTCGAQSPHPTPSHLVACISLNTDKQGWNCEMTDNWYCFDVSVAYFML